MIRPRGPDTGPRDGPDPTIRPRQWITPVTAPRAPRERPSRHHLERRVLAARRAALAWIGSGRRAERIGACLDSACPGSGHAVPTHRHALADYSALLEQWGVPGIAAPPGVAAAMAARWTRSVTLVVLRRLRQQGHLPPARAADPVRRGLRCAEHEGVSPRAGASPAPTKVAPMPERPPTPGPDPDSTHFPPVDLHVEGRGLHLRRLDAQQAVDVARQQSSLARHALRSGPIGADDGPARTAADDASTVLRAAVGVLAALYDDDPAETTALVVDVDVTGPVVVARPHGELDLSTSPRLERACMVELDRGTVELLVVDLSAVSFLDSSALAVLIEIARVCTLGGARFALTRPSVRTRRLLAITRLDTMLEVI